LLSANRLCAESLGSGSRHRSELSVEAAFPVVVLGGDDEANGRWCSGGCERWGRAGRGASRPAGRHSRESTRCRRTHSSHGSTWMCRGGDERTGIRAA
jgi:hypothetical protein